MKLCAVSPRAMLYCRAIRTFRARISCRAKSTRAQALSIALLQPSILAARAMNHDSQPAARLTKEIVKIHASLTDRAVEGVLWFLFSRLAWRRARDRLKRPLS